MHLSIFISVINQLDAQTFCFTISLFHASTCFQHMCSSSGGHHTYRCDDTRGCLLQFRPPDDEHMCSKHVEAWNKTYCKTKILCIKLVNYWDKYTLLICELNFISFFLYYKFNFIIIFFCTKCVEQTQVRLRIQLFYTFSTFFLCIEIYVACRQTKFCSSCPHHIKRWWGLAQRRSRLGPCYILRIAYCCCYWQCATSANTAKQF